MHYGQTSWDAAYATAPPSIWTYGFGTHSYTWYGCSEADVATAFVDTTSTWEEDDPYPPLGYDAAKSGPLPKITKTATTRTTTWTVAGNNLAHVCWVG